MIFQICISITCLILFIYIMAISSSYSDLKHNNELQTKDMYYHFNSKIMIINNEIEEAKRKSQEDHWQVIGNKSKIESLEFQISELNHAIAPIQKAWEKKEG